ncbi:MAG: nucleotidyltransferase family protein, partial [Dehalococcoidia bacterium]|nr:nucleotidyltransferase family protein [Dehalococcoidia bacterium]
KTMKALLPFGETTLLEYQYSSLTSVPEISGVVVVVGHRHEELFPLVEGRAGACPGIDAGMRAVVNPDYRMGRTSSIRAGLREVLHHADGILIIGVDQPRPRTVLTKLVAEHLGGNVPITAPTYRGKRGHPTLFSATLLPELLAVSEEKQGLREVMSRHRAEVRDIEFDTPTVLLDINTQEDYQEALKLLVP